MSKTVTLGRRTILGIGIVCGLFAAVFQGWWLYQWLGATIWFYILVFPACVVSLQVVAGTVAITLHKQYGDPNEALLPDLQRPPRDPRGRAKTTRVAMPSKKRTGRVVRPEP